MMKIRNIYLFVILIAGSTFCSAQIAQPFSSNKIDFDWQFHLGDVQNGESFELNTSNWRLVDIPHDWSIEGSYSLNNKGEWQVGHLPSGIGWYRKHLDWKPEWEGKQVKVMFEGVYLNSDVWINGNHLGHRPNGYIGFEYDLTSYLKKWNNIIAVRVDHSNPLTARWYTGSGIYRHVWLNVRNPINIAMDGVHFTTPEVEKEGARFDTKITIENSSDIESKIIVNLKLHDEEKQIVASESLPMTICENEITEIEFSNSLSIPNLWSPESPKLYNLVIQLEQDDVIIDEQTRKVGFRQIQFSHDFGFKLNGEVVKLKGVCEHHTAGAVGSAVPDDILLYRLRLLKEMGCNAIRTAHNPFSPSFYNICDSLGLLVMNEFTDGWDIKKSDHDYGIYFEKWWKTDAEAFIKRDRNHPSVIIWSIGNEVINPTIELQKELIDFFHKFDQTRPVTQGGHDPTRGMEGEDKPTLLDIKGFNGDGEEIGVLEKFHAKFPNVPVVCTEVPHTYQTRGVYRSKTNWRKRDFPAMWEVKNGGKLGDLANRVFPIPDFTKNEVFPEEVTTHFYQNGKYYPIENNAPWSETLYYQSSYDNASVRSSARKAWQRTRDMDFVMGQFRWGSFDYLGESNNWPSRFANFGVIDICGFPKDHFYLYQSMWTNDPMVHILPHWTHTGKEGIEIPVVIYTNCDEVDLFLNGKLVGNKKYNDEQLVWMVPYEAGEIKAIAKRNGETVAIDSSFTAGKPAKIKLTSDKINIVANRTDVLHIVVEIVDEKGIECPYAENVIEFEVNGPAKIIGVDNGDPLDLSDYKSNVRKTFRGKIMLLIQATDKAGEIELKAKSVDINPDKLIVFSK